MNWNHLDEDDVESLLLRQDQWIWTLHVGLPSREVGFNPHPALLANGHLYVGNRKFYYAGEAKGWHTGYPHEECDFLFGPFIEGPPRYTP